MSDPVERAVRSAFPERSVAAIESKTTRPGNHTAFVTFEGSDGVYVKTATDTTARLVRETAAVRYAAAHSGVGTPAVVAANPTGDSPYLVTAPLSGTLFNDRWTAGDDRATLLERVGEVIAGVHEATFQRSGVVTGGNADGLELEGTSWTETLRRTIEWRASDWFADRFTDLPVRLVDAVREVDPTLSDTTPTLIHGDPSRINVHLDPDGLLDWERALVGDPAFGLLDAAFHHTGQPDVDDAEREALVKALFDGYRRRAGELPSGIERYRELYRAISYLLVPQGFEDWSADAERPADELAGEVREEFDARLDAVYDANA